MEYSVIFEDFTERHFIKSFERKYKKNWYLTQQSLAQEFARVDILFLKSIAEIIVDVSGVKICKTEFKIAGTQESRHGSGNRCIIAIHKEECEVRVLLVYGKTDVSSRNETAEWKEIIKAHYPIYKNIL